MNSTADYKLPAASINGSAGEKCFVCDDPIREHCFCKIHNNGAGSVLLCCPDCALQYLERTQAPGDLPEQELRAYEHNFHFFIGENKPWS